jgi:Nucleotide-diphospho-sugar transferase
VQHACRHSDTLASGDFRADFLRFRQMGSNKPLIVQQLLEARGAGVVVLSDVDTVWLRDPSEFLLRHPTADMLVSTDCLSHWVEEHAADTWAAVHEAGAAAPQPVYYHRCGHLPGATFGRAFNTGVIIFRNRCCLAPLGHAPHIALRPPAHAAATALGLPLPPPRQTPPPRCHPLTGAAAALPPL